MPGLKIPSSIKSAQKKVGNRYGSLWMVSLCEVRACFKCLWCKFITTPKLLYAKWSLSRLLQDWLNSRARHKKNLWRPSWKPSPPAVKETWRKSCANDVYFGLLLSLSPISFDFVAPWSSFYRRGQGAASTLNEEKEIEAAGDWEGQ